MLTPGTVLQKRYRIKRLLAKGGMGAVYEAEAVHLRNVQVAVKETFFDEDQKELREQFEREAATLARLHHPALPQVKDHFIEGEGQFLVMDFIPGDDLGRLLDEQLRAEGEPFDALTVMGWAETLLDALAYIHGQHPAVIHRDIKPQNLKLTPRGELFLIDFGLAKDATTPTRAGGSIHAYTLAYAPPEQIKGTGTDARSDLYSLGATLYHLMTGELPPDARVREEAVVKYQMPDVLRPAHHVNPQLPFAFAAILAKAMALDRAQRHQNAREMRQAVQQVREAIEAEIAEKQRQEWERKRRKEEERKRAEEAARRQAPQNEIEQKKKELAELELAMREDSARERIIEPPEAKRKMPLIAIAFITAIALVALLVYRLGNAGGSANDNAAPPVVEAMRYSLKLKNAAGRSVSGLDPLPAGEVFQFHLTPRVSGFLYLIAPDENQQLTAFVTKRRIEASADFQFPSGDNWINVGKGERFLIIFSPEPLKRLPFLNVDSHPLSSGEQRALRDFRAKLASAPKTVAKNDGAVITTHGSAAGPLAFEINVRRQANN